MIDEGFAHFLVNKYCPQTKLTLTDGCDGLYLDSHNEIIIGRNWHIGGLLHEITHAILHHKDGRNCHDGVFADTLTRLIGEVFCGVGFDDEREPMCSIYYGKELKQDD